MLVNPICFIDQNEKELKLHINAFLYGYVYLYWQKQGQTSLFHSITINSAEHSIPKELFSEGAGIYDFYVMDKTGKCTDTVSTYINKESTREFLNKISNYIDNVEDEEYLNEITTELLRSNVKTNCLEELITNYRAVEEIESFEYKTYCQLINTIEKYLIMKNSSMNKSSMFGVPKVTLSAVMDVTPCPALTAVKVYKIDNNETSVDYIKKVSSMDPFTLTFIEDTKYVIKFYSGTDLILQLNHYQFGGDTLNYLYKKHRDIKIDIEQMTDDIELYTYDLVLSHEEKQNILAERSIVPLDILIPRISWSINADNVITLMIKNYDLLQEMGKQFYIAYKDEDVFLDRTFSIRIPVQSKMTEIQLESAFMDLNTLFWLEDEDMNVLSKFTRYTDLFSYDENRNYIEKKDYIESILSKAKEAFSSAAIDDFLTHQTNVILNDDEIDSDNIRFELIKKVLQSNDNSIPKNKVAYFLLIEFINSHKVSNQIFDSNTIYFSPAWYRYSFPRDYGHQYTLVMNYMFKSNEDTSWMTTYKISDDGTSTDIYVEDYDYSIIYAIDNETYKYSGFTFINNVPGEKCRYSYLINVEGDN